MTVSRISPDTNASDANLADGLEALAELLSKENSGSDAGFDILCLRAAKALRSPAQAPTKQDFIRLGINTFKEHELREIVATFCKLPGIAQAPLSQLEGEAWERGYQAGKTYGQPQTPSDAERIAELQYEAGMYKSLYEAAMARSSEETWQPIETAPKDGTWVLVWEKGINDKYHPAEVARFRDDVWRNSANKRIDVATHWMPLPASPLSRPHHGGDASEATGN